MQQMRFCSDHRNQEIKLSKYKSPELFSQDFQNMFFNE
ncbi:hypothetical protein ADIARSV_4220 [Arcticibacter svalbardensis MN12-7]|uniref:Uncharacterized protein n=1 Tax=Arcticibacter svalbardensis MN12-7 TaxID=1150600 RepID=R9GLW9_9SPHI|nr:hypothetical protein ADIARSV_4220 [Arcticibacter svalbardensis MN12-7]